MAAHLRERPGEYVIELDVSGVDERRLSVESLGSQLRVLGDREETLVLPDDADPEGVRVFNRAGTLEIHAPRTRLEPHRLPIRHRAFLLDPDADGC
jgi:HSP20 family molecular chaperone IbpA